jgi:hypothetical protein
MIDEIICSVCNKEIPWGEEREVIEIYLNTNGATYNVCSPSCLVELSWKLKENQVKLSKSKND